MPRRIDGENSRAEVQNVREESSAVVRARHPRAPPATEVHVAVTAHPTAAWTAQQLRNAFPEDHAPGYLLHDRDAAFTDVVSTIGAMQIREIVTAPRSPGAA